MAEYNLLAGLGTLASTVTEGDVIPPPSTPAMRTRPVPTVIDRISFAKAIAGGIDTDWGTAVIGAGMTVNQANGNLVVTTGTTARSETIIRSVESFSGDIRFRVRSLLSQRIANQNFFAELVDVTGDGLAYTINSATSITVTFPESFPVSSANVGQSFTLCGFSGTGTFFSGRYAVASVSGQNVTFAVTGFAVGSGTVSVVGWNYYKVLYDGTTANNAKFDTGRNGYGSGDTTVTINTTASPGHMFLLTAKDTTAILADQLVASSTGIQQTHRGSRAENVPTDKALRVQIRILNGTTAPASTTTWTIGMVAVAEIVSQDVTVQDVRPMSNSWAMPVDIVRSPTITVSGSVITTPTTPTTTFSNSTAGTNATAVRSAACTLYQASLTNIGASIAYLKIFNQTTAPTAGSGTPVLVIPIPAGELVNLSFGSQGIRMTAGLAYVITGGSADTDTTAVTAGQVKTALVWI